MKRPIGQIENLKVVADHLEKAMHEHNHMLRNRYVGDAARILHDGPLWVDTPEGFDFWDRIYSILVHMVFVVVDGDMKVGRRWTAND